MRNTRQVRTDLQLLEMNYGPAGVIWAADFSWIRVSNYRLPPGYNTPTSPILVLVPQNYGYDDPYKDFFVSSHLRRWSQEGWSKDIPHYFDRFPYQRLSNDLVRELKDGDWGYLCVHPKSWGPTSNILTYLNQVYAFLTNPTRDWS